ncbi:MAG: ABC transporter permease subunit [Crocinitomicaceae bacterium]|nr:ABC transporter permease subunit [Crocinitomicaceae bacterium]
MRTLLRSELFKITRRPRTYIGFGAILIIVLALEFAFFAEGETLIGLVFQNLESVFRLEGKIISVNFLTYMLLNVLIIHVPILICLVTGDIISGEAANGSLRLLLQRPYGRVKIYMAKWLAGTIYTIGLILFLALSSYILGYLLFGEGDLIVFRKGIHVFEASDVSWRFVYAFGMGILSMMVVASLSIMISSFTSNSIGPIVGTIAILIVLNIISTVAVNLMQPVLPYIFTTHFIKWQYFFETEIEWSAIYTGVFVQIGYIILFTTIGLVNFKRKDILT